MHSTPVEFAIMAKWFPSGVDRFIGVYDSRRLEVRPISGTEIETLYPLEPSKRRDIHLQVFAWRKFYSSFVLSIFRRVHRDTFHWQGKGTEEIPLALAT